MPRLAGIFSVVLALIAAIVAGCGSNGGSAGTATATGTPVVATVAEGQSALHAARLDAAKRLGVEPLSVELHDVQGAGFSSSCMGVRWADNRPCTADLGAGYVAFFRAAGGDLRYHFLGFKYVGPIAASQVGDAPVLPASLHVDLGSELSRYAREDFALREKLAPAMLAVVNVAPDAGGALVVVEGGGKTGAYRAAPATGIALAASAPSIAPQIAAVELAMREDLAKRLKADIATISILNYEAVTWPDGCIGVQKPGAVCTQALVPGFLAILADGAGKTYRYHGTADSYIAASFEVGATLTEPTRTP